MTKLRGYGAVLFCIFVATALLSAIAPYGYADQPTSPISGRLAATYDSSKGTVTAMVAGYTEGRAVTIGPSTWPVSEEEFSDLRAEDVGKTLCGERFALKKVTKSAHNGKDIVADVIIVRSE